MAYDPTDPIMWQVVDGLMFQPNSDELREYLDDHPGAEIHTVRASDLAGDQQYGAPSYQESTEDMLEAYLRYGPEFAEQQFAEQELYLPQQTELAIELQREYGPEQYDLMLEQMRQYLPQFAELDMAAAEKQRQQELQQVLEMSGMLPDIRAAAEDPAITAMRNMLIQQVSDELAMGMELSPDQARNVEQGQRASEIARGLGEGQGSANREAVAKAIEGLELQQQRQQAAGDLLSQEYAAQIDPFLAVLGRPATSLTSGQAAMSSGLNQPTQAGYTPASAEFLNMATNVYGQASSNALTAQQLQGQQDQSNSMMNIAAMQPYLVA